MKTLMTALLMILFISTTAQTDNELSILNDDENTWLSAYVDPTFTDPGAQYGLTLTKELLYGYMEVSASIYPELEPTYTDLIFSGGLSIEKKRITAHIGPRAGFEMRGGGPFVIFGGQLRLLYGISDNIYLGVQGWVDYRYSQDAQFYGNDDMIKHNAGFILAIKLN